MAPADGPTSTAAIEAQQHLDRLRSLGLLERAHTPAVRLLDADAPEPDGCRTLTLHLVRHGQGFHNLLGDEYRQRGVHFSSTGDDFSENNPYRRPELLDPPLTAIGRKQARALQSHTRTLGTQAVVVSPLARAASTALLAFAHLVGTSVPFLAREEAREQAGVHTCDQRNDLADIAIDFPTVDLGALSSESDPLWHDTRREPPEEVCARAHALLLWLRARPESELAVVTHSAFLFVLLNAVVQSGSVPPGEGVRAWFATGELRTVRLAISL